MVELVSTVSLSPCNRAEVHLRSGGRKNTPQVSVPPRCGEARMRGDRSERGGSGSSCPLRPAAGLEVGGARRHFVPLSGGSRSRGFAEGGGWLRCLVLE